MSGPCYTVAMYTRILLKLSGEQLAGEHEFGVDPKIAQFLAREIKPVVDAGMQIAIVVGGGNMVRGAEVAGNGIRRVTADQMGMLSGLINAMALTDIFESEGLKTRCLSSVFVEQLAESFSYRLAEKHLQNGRVLLIAGGMARPYFSHDTAAVSLGLELDCDVVIKSTKVDGLYDKDPAKFPDAKRLENVTLAQAASDDNIRVMDRAAIGLAAEQGKPIMIVDAFTPGNLMKVVSGEPIGTLLR